MKTVRVKTPCGIVLGKEENETCIFQGIPYAETGRFEKPVMMTKWEGELDATKRGADCPQYETFNDEAKDQDNFYYQEFRSDETDRRFTEDVVNLNIVSPRYAIRALSEGEQEAAETEKVPANKRLLLPVLVYIHGGGFETGTVSELPGGVCTEYAGRDIVYVAIGYRLNVFSLFNSMNYGLLDQVMSLKWLQENIAAFGGDPAHMTLIGQSAGAMSIMDLCYSGKLKGLVQGAVLMSGGGMVPGFVGPLTREEFWPFWEKIMLECGARNIEELKKTDAEKLWRTWYQESRAAKSLRFVQPGIDGEIITDRPDRITARGEQLDIPYMIGVTSQDFMPAIIYEMAVKWAKTQRKAGMQPVYGYFFDRELPGNRFKAFHASDLWYVFGNRDQCWRPFGETDDRLAEEMIDYIAAFVKTGNPNDGKHAQWPDLSKQKKFKCFDGKENGLIGPFACRKKLWHTFLKDKGPM